MKTFHDISINNSDYQQVIDYSLDLIQKGINIFLLDGNLGAGKTFFVQQLLTNLGVKEHITSPTFSILNTYQSNIGEVYHYDLYRIKHRDELINLNIEDGLLAPLMFVEWPQIAESFFAKHNKAIISIAATQNNCRDFTFLHKIY